MDLMKKIFLIGLSLLAIAPALAYAQLTVPQGGTGSTSLSGILIGDSTIRLKTLTVGSGLTLTGTTLSSTGGGGFGEAWQFFSSKAYLAPTTTVGIIVNASSTIGDGSRRGGFTINGGATTTGIAYFGGGLGLTNATSGAMFIDGGTGRGLVVAGGTGGNTAALTIANFNSSSCAAGVASYGAIDVSNNAMGIYAPKCSNGRIVFIDSAGNETARFSSSNFGVGDNIPSAKLSVAGNAAIGFSANSGQTAPTNGLTVVGLSGFGSTSPYARLSIHANDGNTTQTLFAIGSSTSAATTTLFSIDNQGNTSLTGNIRGMSDNTYISFDAGSDRVGFTKKLGVTGKLAYGSLSTFAITQSSATNIAPANAFTDRLVIDVNGKVGIATTTPYTTLSVEGASALGNSALAGYFIATSTTASSFAGGFLANASSTIGDGTQIGGLTVNGGATTTKHLQVGDVFASQVNSAGGIDANGAVVSNTSFTIPGITKLTAGNLYASGGWSIDVSDGTTAFKGISIPGMASGQIIPKVGIGSTTPFAEFSIHAKYGSNISTLFAVGSSSLSATTTLFSIDNTGAITTQLSSGLTSSNSGALYTAASSTLYGTGTAGQVLMWSGSSPVWAATSTSAAGVTSVTATAPLFSSGGATPNITYTGLVTTTQPSTSNLLVSNGTNGVYGVATGTVSAGSSAITVTAGRSVIGGALAIDCATAGSGQNGCLSSTDWSTFNGKAGFAFPWTPTNVFGVNTNATSTTLSLLNGLNASSTVRFGNAGTTTLTWDSKLGALGIGTSSPYAMLSIFAASTTGSMVVPTMLFAISSTTAANATTTLFSIDNTGAITTNLTGSGFVKTSGAGTKLTVDTSTYLTSAVTSVTGTFPISSSGGNTPSITFGGLSTSSAISSGAAVLYATGVNTVASAATGTITGSTGLTVTAGQSIIGSGLTITNTGVTSIVAGGNVTISGGTGAVTVNSTWPWTANAATVFYGQVSNSTTTEIHYGGVPTSLSASSTAQFEQINIGSTTIGTLATSTNFGNESIRGTASTTALIVSNLGAAGTPCLTVNTNGQVATQSCATGSVGNWFTPTNVFGVNTNATSTILSLLAGLNASSTVRFGNAATTTLTWNSNLGMLGIGTSTPYAFFSLLAASSTTNMFVPTTLFTIASTTAAGVTTSLFSIDNRGQLVSTSNATSSMTLTGVINPGIEQSFTYATSTAWTGTTTIYLENVIFPKTYYGVMCSTDVGTVQVNFYSTSTITGTGMPKAVTASTSNTFNAFFINNTFKYQTLIKVDLGTPASSPTKVNCTVLKTLTPQ